jgi:N6-adenosine-specific RNA methylase IME4
MKVVIDDMSDWPFGDLRRGYYGALYADPPWHFKVYSLNPATYKHVRHSSWHYQTMDINDIMALPVANLAAPDAVLFLWFSWPQLEDALKTITAWGFVYKTCAFAWMKADASQIEMFRDDYDVQIGLGYWTRANSEVCLLATRGKPKRDHADVRQGIIEPRRDHSRKPDCVYERIERLVAGPYCELFARQRRPGWDSWGNEL